MSAVVALRKESVDRNSAGTMSPLSKPVSLSARRAWIEMWGINYLQYCHHTSLSARRAWIEMTLMSWPPRLKTSLSARRAWIEIEMSCRSLQDKWVALRKESVDRNNPVVPAKNGYTAVALRKESVDRNITLLVFYAFSNCRSPQGERG